MEKKSIYQILRESYKEVPQLPYIFQDPYQAGKKDIMCAFWENEVSYLEQEIRVYQLMEQIQNCIEEHLITSEIGKYLRKYQLASYLTKLTVILWDHLEEGIFQKEDLYWIGIQLAAKSSGLEEVKLGVLILGLFQEKIARDLVWVLGLHSEFTLYALEAANYYENRNEFVFELAKNTRGYGKMAALQLLQPITEEQQDWVMEYGAENEAVTSISAIMCLNKAAMYSYYKEYPIDAEHIENVSYLVVHAFARESIDNFKFCKEFVTRYLEAAKENASSFLDLAALCTIEQNAADYHCTELLSNEKWQDIVLEEMKQGDEDIIPSIGMILNTLGIQPDFEVFLPLLQKRPFDLDLLRYFLEQHAEQYQMDLFQYIQENMPDDVLKGEKVSIPDKAITQEYEADVWVLFLLQSFRTAEIFQEKFCISCLNARSHQVREEALRNLYQFHKQWKGKEEEALRQAILTEPDPELKKEMEQLLAGEMDNES